MLLVLLVAPLDNIEYFTTSDKSLSQGLNSKMQPKKEENFSDYAKTLYSNSLVTGIPEIVISHNWYLRIMRLVVFVCCIVGFIYQSLDFMDLYWKYPTILDIQITRKGEIMMPALTACDANGIRLSKYCQSYPCRKVEQEHRFCRCYPEGRYCNKRKLYPHVKIPLRMDDISQTVFLSQSERAHMMPQKESFIPSCVMKRPPSMVINCGNLTVSPACSNRVMEPTACFSINSLYMKPHEKPRNISVSTVIELALFSPPYEYDPDLMIMYKQLSLHSPYSLSNPFTEGLFLNSEKTYKVYVKQTVKNLLKPPYDTNCFDYLEAWKKNGGKGAMSESDCLQLCKMEIQLKKPGKCLSFNLWYPSNEYRCPTGKRWCEKEGRLLNSSECYNKPGIDLQSQFEDESCESQCKPGCW
ncbi:uncharacterized protein CDAR_109651 [Caerostris darwini]|uniref:Sodium channel protein Nach n=1 Tax=Caerostris darwini TaxID=1538125 RepID=A0AAV4SMD0_9ARAC|nr:uncharacterized protein CDAR_109651 [Caerostris darwini]